MLSISYPCYQKRVIRDTMSVGDSQMAFFTYLLGEVSNSSIELFGERKICHDSVTKLCLVSFSILGNLSLRILNF